MQDSCDYRDHLQRNRDAQMSHSIQWVFILANKLTRQQRRKVNRFLYTEEGWENNFGTNFQDYLKIMEKIQESHQNVQVFLVADLPSYSAIFDKQMRKKYQNFLQTISCVYLFPFQKGQTDEIQRLKNENKLIDKQFHKFQSFISQNQKEILKNPLSKCLFANFNILGLDQSEKISKEKRMKIYACITLEEKYYDEYMDKFVKVLQRQTSLNVLNKYVQKQIEEAIRLLKTKKRKKFYRKIFALYKVESRFYYIVNNSIKRFSEQNFDWDSYALPVSLLFKAIKFYFTDPQNKEEIQKLFDKNGECILWRAAKFSNDQLKQIQKTKTKQNVFYELISFTSTSLSKQVAMSFLDPLDLESCCLIKYILKKPKFQKQIDRLDFVLFSFAHLFGNDTLNHQQLEVLLNSLTICKLKQTKLTQISQIKKISERLDKKFEFTNKKIEISIIEMEVVENIIQNCISKANRLYTKECPKFLKHCLSTIDIIKSNKAFDIGHAFQYSGCLQKALHYFENLLNQEYKKKQKNQKQMYYLQSRIAEILQKMDNNEDALIHVRKAIQICKFIQKEQENTNRKEHQQLLFKMIQKSGYLLQTNYFYHQAIKQVTQQIDFLQKKACENNIKRLVYLFQYAQYLIMRGMIHFRQGEMEKAKQDINKSRKTMEQIMEDINYDDIKQQTFFWKFILEFLTNESIPWDKNKYYVQERAKKIKEATALFGGQDRLLKVFECSKHLSQQFALSAQKRKKQRIQQQKRQKELDPNYKILQQSKIDQQIQREIRQQILDSPQTKKLQKQSQQFLAYLNQLTMNKEMQTASKIQILEKQMINILVQIVPQQLSLKSISIILTSLCQFSFCSYIFLFISCQLNQICLITFQFYILIFITILLKESFYLHFQNIKSQFVSIFVLNSE